MIGFQESVIFPTLHHETDMSGLEIRTQTQLSSRPLNTIISNSFGFGGNCTSLVFKKWNG